MGIYDTTIKTLFTRYPGRNLRRLIRIPEGARALPTEFTRVEFVDEVVSHLGGERLEVVLSDNGSAVTTSNRQADGDRKRIILAQSLEVDYLVAVDGRPAPFIHVEFQSTFEARMPSRMLSYRAGIVDRYGRWTKSDPWVPDVEQVLVNLYKEPWGQSAGIATRTLTLGYRIVDLCNQSASTLLEDGDPADAVVSLLCHKGLVPGNLKRMMEIIGAIPEERLMKEYLATALALAKLRDATATIEGAIRKMPIQLDLSDSEFLRRPISAAFENGTEIGARANALDTFRMAVEEAFGKGTVDLTHELEPLDAGAISRLALRVHRSESVDELLGWIAELSGNDPDDGPTVTMVPVPRK